MTGPAADPFDPIAIGRYLPQFSKDWQALRVDREGVMLEHRIRGVRVIFSAHVERDGKPWLHLSVSRRSRIPDWDDLQFVRGLFLEDREAYQVFPPKDRYVNENFHVLHLWACIDGPRLPDFRRSINGRMTI